MAGASVKDFAVPVRPADLEAGDGSSWKVTNRVDAQRDLLLRAAERLKDEAAALAEPETFDLAYAANSSFAQLPADAQQATCELMAVAVQQAARACKRALSDSAPDRELAQCRSVLKAAVYLQFWLVQEAEKVQAKASMAPTVVAARGASTKG